MDTALLMDTMIHLLASSLLLMFDCDHTFLLILYFYILYTFPFFSLLGLVEKSNGQMETR